MICLILCMKYVRSIRLTRQQKSGKEREKYDMNRMSRSTATKKHTNKRRNNHEVLAYRVIKLKVQPLLF